MKRISVRKGYMVCALALIVALGFAGTASAHVLLVDRQANIAAVLHINPDDDPVAGEPSELYFDVQDADSDTRIPYSAYQLVITDEQNNNTVVRTVASNNTVGVEYTFPTRGLYRLNLRSNPGYDSLQKISLQTSVRVSRGAGVSANADRYPWATAGLWVGGVLLVMLLTQAVVNWRTTIAGARF